MGAVSLQEVRDPAGAQFYPRAMLVGLETALMGFCAAFYGRQDCVWVAEAGLTATGVDVDAEKLEAMRDAYPDNWTFVNGDLFEYADRRYAQGETYDLVNMDPPSNLFQPVADLAPLWCELANRLVLLATGVHTTVDAPEGWQVTGRLKRSTYLGGVFWTILEPA